MSCTECTFQPGAVVHDLQAHGGSLVLCTAQTFLVHVDSKEVVGRRASDLRLSLTCKHSQSCLHLSFVTGIELLHPPWCGWCNSSARHERPGHPCSPSAPTAFRSATLAGSLLMGQGCVSPLFNELIAYRRPGSARQCRRQAEGLRHLHICHRLSVPIERCTQCHALSALFNPEP